MDNLGFFSNLPGTTPKVSQARAKSSTATGGSVKDDEEFVYVTSDFFTSPEYSVLIFASKCETFTLRNNLRQFHQKLKQVFGLGIIELKQELNNGLLEFCKLVVVAGINKPLTNDELQLLNKYLYKGGSILVLAEENCKPEFYNEFTAPFGITLVKDAVISAKRIKMYLPKQCFLENIVSSAFRPLDNNSKEPKNFNVIYPYGCTLNLSNMAIPFACTGALAFPSHRPVGAIYIEPTSKGKLLVLGSGHTFGDGYMNKEDNSDFLQFVLEMLCGEGEFQLPNDAAGTDSEITLEAELVYATSFKSSCQRGVLEDNKVHLFPGIMNALDEPDIYRAFESCSSSSTKVKCKLTTREVCKETNVTCQDLGSLVKPLLEVPLPPVKLAVHGPLFRYDDSPALELFDLDEEFSKPEQRLDSLFRKCTEDDLSYCIESMGNILDIKVPAGETENKLEDPDKKAKSVLYHMLKTLTDAKSTANHNNRNNDESAHGESD